MPLILVPSSAKRIATEILVIAKLNGKKYILRGFVCDIIRPSKGYLFKVINWITRIRCENYSRLRTKTLERCQWPHSCVFIVNCKHISIFILIAEFEQVHIEKTNTFEEKIGYIMRYVAVFSVRTKFI